jgi:DNA-directed RNA polymerase subunit H
MIVLFFSFGGISLAKKSANSIFNHFLVPKHEIVSPQEKEELIKKYGVDEEKLPGISRDDPAVQEIGAKKGDLIKIYRDSLTAGKSIYYRIVR